MRIRSDGSVQSSATPTHQNAGRPEDFAMYRCMVVRVVYVDDPRNITANSTNPRVLYDCVILGGWAAGQRVTNARLSSNLGGNDSYWERTLKASTKDVSSSRLSDCDGDIVFVQFNQGDPAFPVIVGLDNGINTVDKIGAAKAEGPRSVRQYNGVEETINNDGELQVDVKGGTADSESGSFEPADAPLFSYKVSKNEAVTMVFKSGLRVTYDGQNDVASIVTKGGAKAVINGTADDVKLSTKGTGTLHLAEGKVALGASSAELLHEISQALDKHIQFLNATDALHTHIGNLGYPTLLPQETAQFVQLANDLTSIKAKIDGIKGSV